MRLAPRTKTLLLAATLIITVVAGVLFLRQPPKPDSPVPMVHDFPGRLQYQADLNASSQRFWPGFSIVVLDERVYMRTDRDLQSELGYCDRRCGTVAQMGTSYQIALPVGYAHGSNVSPNPTSQEPVASLIFWNPVEHRIEIAYAESGQKAVKLPQVLKDGRKTSDIKPGETAYTTADFIRQTPDGKTWMLDLALGYELLGIEYGYVINTGIRRKADGTLEARLPQGIKPLFEESIEPVYAVPVSLAP